MESHALFPYRFEHGENSNGNISLAAPAFDEDKLLIYREIYYDGFSTVIAARDLTSGGAVSIKKTDYSHLGNYFTHVAHLQRRVTTKLRKQTACIRSLSHPAVMKMLDFVSEPQRIVVISEMCLFGDIFNWMLQQHVIRFRDVLIILHGLFQAFHFIHDKGYSHGYLKPTNVLFQTISPHSLVVLPDLSVKKEIAYLLNEPLNTCQSCTAPEALKRLIAASEQGPALESATDDEYNYFGTKEMDVWSIGAITLIALTGINFFHYDSIEDMKQPMEERLDKAFSHPIIKMCNKQLVTNLKLVLNIDPEGRITAAAGANINWVDEAKVSDDDRNLLYMMEHDLLNTCKYFRMYGQNVLQDLLCRVRRPQVNMR
ncbi:unnamed protein product [Hydatigera taeniaeformis]|uniref:Protein kinase domain-containing protein n=1 Tax=Hydatigena taeniaeformis TaxID=6205 RepID=A0A0R3WJ94_HYDTA|nr:unnamed protein product [Hydatigera taeniaeformis]